MTEQRAEGEQPVTDGTKHDAAMTEPDVVRSWLRFDDVDCVRGGRHWAGPEGDVVYVVKGEGCVCPDHITEAEKARARPQT